MAGTSRSRGFELQLSGHTHGGPIVVNALLDADARWARARPDVVAIALVGSHTRGTTHAESDVDLDLVVDDPARFLASDDWLHAFGDVHIAGDERYGAVTSRCAF